MADRNQHFQGLIWLICRKCKNVIFPNVSLPQWLFLPQMYKIGTLILQSLIHTPKFPKILPIISGNVLPQLK